MNQKKLINVVTIADDSTEDFESIRKTLKKTLPNSAEFNHAKDIEGLLGSLEKMPPDLLIQDINIPRSGTDDDDSEAGLTALFDIVYKFPHMPVIINSGQLLESQQTLRKLLNKKMPIVGVLDKSEYDKEDVLSVLFNAHQFLLNSSDWREEHAEALRTRMEAAESKLLESELLLFHNEKLDIAIRAESEARLNEDNSCPLCFLRVCQALEEQIKKMNGRDFIVMNMGQNINNLKHKNLVNESLRRDLHRSWALRNSFIHNIKKVDNVTNVKFVVKTLKRIRSK